MKSLSPEIKMIVLSRAVSMAKVYISAVAQRSDNASLYYTNPLTHEDLVGGVLLAVVRTIDDGHATRAKVGTDFDWTCRRVLVQLAIRAKGRNDAMLMSNVEDALGNFECCRVLRHCAILCGGRRASLRIALRDIQITPSP